MSCCDEPRCGHHCQLCPKDHEPCEFRSGSSICVKIQCRNPHHRQPDAAESARRAALQHSPVWESLRLAGIWPGES